MLKKVVAAVGKGVSAFELGVSARCSASIAPTTASPCTTPGVRGGASPAGQDSGFSIDTPYGLEGLENADLIAIPAWKSTTNHRRNARGAAPRGSRGARVMSVCTGAFVLAAAGLLDGGSATTHWIHAAELARRYPAIDVDPNVLYVERVCADQRGNGAGIDLCLHVVREEHGAAVANAVARRMVVPPHRDGGQAQYIEAPMVEHDRADDLAVVLDWVQANLNKPFGVDHLARRANMSLRTFNRRFAATTEPRRIGG